MNPEKRSRILLIAAVVFGVGYLLYVLFGSNKPKAPAIPNVDTKPPAVQNVDTKTPAIPGGETKTPGLPSTEQRDAGYASISFDRYMVERAEKPWGRDPFAMERSVSTTLAKDPAEAGAKQQFVYMGYIEMGNVIMAVIDNTEYRVGEMLNMDGYYLKAVTPSHVIIEKRKDKIEISVPLSE
jgi:hypothetical protein